MQPLFRVERRQVVEQDLGLDRLRVFEIDRIDLEQGEIPFALARAADGTVNGVARAQAEAANLGRGDIYIIRTRKIIHVRAAQETESVRQDLEHAVGDDLDFLISQGLEDGKQQILFAQIAGVLDLEALGEGDQVFRCFLVELLQGDAAIGDDRFAVVILVARLLVDHRQIGGGHFLAGRARFNLCCRFSFGRVGDVGHVVQS